MNPDESSDKFTEEELRRFIQEVYPDAFIELNRIHMGGNIGIHSLSLEDGNGSNTSTS